MWPLERATVSTALSLLSSGPLKEKCSVIEKESGLHFILRLHSGKENEEVKKILLDQGIRISVLSDFSLSPNIRHDFLISYSNLDMAVFSRALEILSENI